MLLKYITIWVPIFKKHLQRFNVLLVGRWGKGLMINASMKADDGYKRRM